MGVGPRLAPWKEVEFDFHIISTGRGEQAFIIMPDGTSMLIDAGDYNGVTEMMAPAVPDTFRRPGDYIAGYVKAVNPHGDKVDYLMVSHSHSDHTGDTTRRGLPVVKGPVSEYVCCGIMEAGQQLRFGTVFDRGYPDYNYPKPVNDPDVDNQRKFYANKKAEYGLKQEPFVVGRRDQIRMLHGGNARAPFAIRNIAANGEVWKGTAEDTVKLYDLDPRNFTDWQNENTNSLVIRVDYGPFSLYTGGDFNGQLYSGDGDSKIEVENVSADTGAPACFEYFGPKVGENDVTALFDVSGNAAGCTLPAFGTGSQGETILSVKMPDGSVTVDLALAAAEHGKDDKGELVTLTFKDCKYSFKSGPGRSFKNGPPRGA